MTIDLSETVSNLEQGVQAIFRQNTLQFSQWIDDVFQPVGADGCPDPAVNPMGAWNYLNNRRSVIQGAANQKPLIRLTDKNHNILTNITGELNCTYEDLM